MLRRVEASRGKPREEHATLPSLPLHITTQHDVEHREEEEDFQEKEEGNAKISAHSDLILLSYGIFHEKGHGIKIFMCAGIPLS